MDDFPDIPDFLLRGGPSAGGRRQQSHPPPTSSQQQAPPADASRPEQNAHAEPKEDCKSTIDVESLRVSDDVKVLIRNGKPEGQRAQAVLEVVCAMIKSRHSDQEIIAVLILAAREFPDPVRSGMRYAPQRRKLCCLSLLRGDQKEGCSCLGG